MKDGKMCIGMVGCGQIMPSTAKGILASQHCIIDAVMDIDADAAKEKGEMYAVPYYTDLWEFLARPEMDIVYIAVPHALHVPIGIEAARAGKHVIVEKPMATAVEDAKMLVAECREAGVKLTQAMGMRYGATTKLTHDLIQAGAIGDFTSYLVRSIGMKDAKYWSNGVFGQAKRSCWRAYKGMAGGGILVMNAVHNLDALYYMTGATPVEVMAMGGNYSSRSALEDSMSLLIRFREHDSYGVCQAMSAAHVQVIRIIPPSSMAQRAQSGLPARELNCSPRFPVWATRQTNGSRSHRIRCRIPVQCSSTASQKPSWKTKNHSLPANRA